MQILIMTTSLLFLWSTFRFRGTGVRIFLVCSRILTMGWASVLCITTGNVFLMYFSRLHSLLAFKNHHMVVINPHARIMYNRLRREIVQELQDISSASNGVKCFEEYCRNVKDPDDAKSCKLLTFLFVLLSMLYEQLFFNLSFFELFQRTRGRQDSK